MLPVTDLPCSILAAMSTISAQDKKNGETMVKLPIKRYMLSSVNATINRTEVFSKGNGYLFPSFTINSCGN